MMGMVVVSSSIKEIEIGWLWVGLAIQRVFYSLQYRPPRVALPLQ